MKKAYRRTVRLITRTFLQGLVVIVPVTLTGAILYWLAVTAESFLGGLVQVFFPDWHYWHGLGVLLGVALIFAAGLLMNAWVTRRVLVWAESVMERIPVVKSIYSSVRDLVSFVSGKDRGGFSQVVAVTVAERTQLIGFVTREDFDSLPPQLGDPQETIAVYLPMSYQIGGYTVYLPRSSVTPMEISTEDAMRLTLTAGMSGGRRQSARGAENAQSTAAKTAKPAADKL